MRTRILLQGVFFLAVYGVEVVSLTAKDNIPTKASAKETVKQEVTNKQEAVKTESPTPMTAPSAAKTAPAQVIQAPVTYTGGPTVAAPQVLAARPTMSSMGYDPDGGGQLGYMLQLHNSQRARYGLGPLQMNPLLNQAAQQYADYVGRTRSFSHYADGRSPGDRIASTGYRSTSWAENLAWTGSDAGTAMNTWMNSGGHRANILSGHQEVGFGVSNGVWVAVFGNSAGGGYYSNGFSSNGYVQNGRTHNGYIQNGYSYGQSVSQERIVNGGQIVYSTPVPGQVFGERIISERITSIDNVPVNNSPTTSVPANGTPTPAPAPATGK